MIGVLLVLLIAFVVTLLLLVILFQLPRFKHGECCLHEKLDECVGFQQIVPKSRKINLRHWVKRAQQY